MARFGFCGPSYRSQSPNVDAESTVNWYPEAIESGQGKSTFALYPTPGLKSAYALDGEVSVPALFTHNGRMFSAGASLWEEFADGTKINRGALYGVPVNPPSITANQNQLLIAANGALFVFTFAMNVLTPVNMTQLQGPVSQVGYSDGFFAATILNSNKWQVSSPLDGFTWPGAQVAAVSVFAEPIVSMICDHRYIVLLGQKRSVGYYDSGNTFPYDVDPSGYAEVGSDCTFGSVRLDNTDYFLGGYEGGMTMAFKLQGVTPMRVSNHAVEYQWSKYPAKATDAIAFPYQDQGHSFWVIYFPSGKATWAYDVATSSWSERSYLDSRPGYGPSAHLAMSHAYCFGKHFVGSRLTGTIYEMSIAYADDDGKAIQRVRIAPYINRELEWLTHKRFTLDAEAGVGTQVGQGQKPAIMLSFSDDQAHTFSNEYDFSWSQVGDYLTRGIVSQLGASRGRAYKVATSDPVPWRITDAYVNDPSERLSSRLRESA